MSKSSTLQLLIRSVRSRAVLGDTVGSAGLAERLRHGASIPWRWTTSDVARTTGGSDAAIRCGAYALALLYTAFYLHDSSLPGNQPQYPLGWWGWWDQSQYLASARAFAAGILQSQVHWFPLGYSLAAAPFVGWLPTHAFFFLDLGAILVAYRAFVSFAAACGFATLLAIVLFLLATFGDSKVAEVWAQPWNTTLSAALIWGLLAVSARLVLEPAAWRPWRLCLFGLIVGCMPLVRPTDAELAVVATAFVVGCGRARRVLRLRHAVCAAMAAAAACVPYGVLYLRIYGLHPTPYMINERQLGFVLSRLGWKTHLLLIESRPWYPFGESFLARFPWLALSIAGIVQLALPGWRRFRRAPLVLLAAMVLPYWALFFSYVDLQPSGLWRYHNIHYFKWSLPGLALLAVAFLYRLGAERPRQGLAVLAVVIGVLSIRLVPVRAVAGGSAEMVQLAGPSQPWFDTFVKTHQFSDATGRLQIPYDDYPLPDSQGGRVIALRRPIIGQLVPKGLDAGRVPVIYWHARVAIGYPCWLPPYPCRHLPPGS